MGSLPSKEERRIVLKGVYDHLRWVRDEAGTFYDTYLQKIHRLMTVQVLLFAGMSFALSKIGWTKDAAAYHVWILAISGGLAGLSLLVGFIGCIQCLGITDVSVAGIAKLKEIVETERIKRMMPADLFGDLSQNIMQAVLEDRERGRKRKKWGPLINWATSIGAVLVAFFVSYAIIGSLAANWNA